METQFMVKKKTEVPPELLSKEFLVLNPNNRVFF